MTTQMSSGNKEMMLYEIIDNVAELPLESQNWILMMAKSMKYTRDCMIMKNKTIMQSDKKKAVEAKEVYGMGNKKRKS